MIKSVVEWSDAALGFMRTSWSQANATTAAALVAALQNHSNAGVAERVEGSRIIVSTAPVDALYPTFDTFASLEFCTALGKLVRLQLPAPQSGIFLASSPFEVDATAITDIITAALAVLTDESGLAVTAFAGGSRQSRRRDQP